MASKSSFYSYYVLLCLIFFILWELQACTLYLDHITPHTHPTPPTISSVSHTKHHLLLCYQLLSPKYLNTHGCGTTYWSMAVIAILGFPLDYIWNEQKPKLLSTRRIFSSLDHLRWENPP